MVARYALLSSDAACVAAAAGAAAAAAAVDVDVAAEWLSLRHPRLLL